MASHLPNDDRHLQPVWRAQPYQRPFVEAFYLEKASREGRMLTLGGKLRDFSKERPPTVEIAWTM
jgi:hypothetical protein